MPGEGIRFVMTCDDLRAIVAIDAECDDGLLPVTEKELHDVLWQSQAISGWLFDSGCGPEAFAIFETSKHQISLLALGVSPASRRKGIGTYLVNEIKRKLKPPCRSFVACVSERNLDAQLWLRANHLRAMNVARNLFGDGHDGFAFEYTRTDAPIVRKEDEAWARQLL